jgi:cytosine/adenosine deaminase-related metal-dependent hydrolase
MRLVPELVLTPDGWRRDVAVTVSDGRITDLGAVEPAGAGDVALPAPRCGPAQSTMHVHVAEGRYEGERTLREDGATPLRQLDRLGALGRHTIAVHAVPARPLGAAARARRGPVGRARHHGS